MYVLHNVIRRINNKFSEFYVEPVNSVLFIINP